MDRVPAASDRHARLQDAILYLVCSLRPGGRALEDVLAPALAGRRGHRPAARQGGRAATSCWPPPRIARRLCDETGALLILNDRPELVAEAGADGCHVGQDDMDVPAARALAGEGAIVGQSTHFPDEIDAGAAADYIGVGPVYATPTKPGRPAVGLELVRFAGAHAPVPFFAIGGIDASNVEDVVDAGARRIAVVRAIADAEDPRAAAAALRAALVGEPVDGIA